MVGGALAVGEEDDGEGGFGFVGVTGVGDDGGGDADVNRVVWRTIGCREDEGTEGDGGCCGWLWDVFCSADECVVGNFVGAGGHCEVGSC